MIKNICEDPEFAEFMRYNDERDKELLDNNFTNHPSTKRKISYGRALDHFNKISYQVKKGDTYESIANQFEGINPTVVQRCNKEPSLDEGIYIRLYVPKNFISRNATQRPDNDYSNIEPFLII